MPNWRTAFKSDYMASWDLDHNIVLTIQNVTVGDVQLQKKEKKVVAHFVEKAFKNGEPIKPMILNATNCKALNMATGTKETEDWKNIQVEIGVVENKGRIGESHGLAILRVLNAVKVDKLSEIKSMFDKVKDVISPEEFDGVSRVINNQEANSYEKTLNFLKSKLSENAG